MSNKNKDVGRAELLKGLERAQEEHDKREAESMAKWLENDRKLIDSHPLSSAEEAAAEKFGFTPFEYRHWRNEQAEEDLFQGMREEIYEGEEDWRKAGAVVRGQETATRKRQEGRIERGELYDKEKVRAFMVKHMAKTGEAYGIAKRDLLEIIGKDQSFFRGVLSKKSILAALEEFKKNK